MSRPEIEAAHLGEGPLTLAVCIAYPDGRLHKVQAEGRLLAVHHVRFPDVDERGAYCFPDNKAQPVSTFPPMTRGQALDILDFVAKYPEAERIVVACQGGVSRSRGVAAGLCAVIGLDDAHVYAAGVPNVHCKRQIVDAAHASMLRLVDTMLRSGDPVDAPPVTAVHVLAGGRAFCGFGAGSVPRDWPPGHTWVAVDDPAGGATCHECVARVAAIH